MDLLYTQRFDGFCLVSSDSDFTRLAQRLREEGLTVYGFGEKKTPDAFVRACDKFVYTEVLRKEAEASAPPKPATATPAKKTAAKSAPAKPASAAIPAQAAATESKERSAEPLPLALIRQAIEEASDENGWAFLGAVGSYLNKIQPDFDPRLYGHRKLSDLLKHQPRHFVIEERVTPGSSNKSIYIREAG
jgi:uncharacterized LabA/DUF88 family protein